MRLAPLRPLSYALRASARRDAFCHGYTACGVSSDSAQVLPPHLDFTKRTHRFGRGKMGLSICDRMSYAGKICQETVGSFSETNPPVRLRTLCFRFRQGFSGRDGGRDGAVPRWPSAPRDLRAKPFDSASGKGTSKTCVSAKRTQIILLGIELYRFEIEWFV